MNGLIDSHAHLTFNKTMDTETLVSNAKKENVTQIINICTDNRALEAGIELAKESTNIYNAAAVTPHDVEKESLFFQQVEKYAKNNKLIAIGETGLDYFYHKKNKSLQIAYFIKHIELAKKMDLPLIIHCRDAFDDLFEMTTPFLPFDAVLHCFTGTIYEQKKVLEMGWYISFSGIITFKNSIKLQEVVKNTPLNKMLIETDTPFLAPQKYRGKSNEPAFLIETAKKIAELKNIDVEEVIKITSKNTKSLFSLN